MTADTIFALSSGRPPAAIAVIRISGPLAHQAGAAIAGELPEPRHASVRALHSADGRLLDQALVLRFNGPASATGEDSVEFHCHGGRAVADAVLGALAGLDGVRQAEPGEFTRRAFDHGRIDLTEAEGLADLIEAETESQRRAALMLAEGGLRRQIETWRQHIVALSAQAEAAIDYVDEEVEYEGSPLAAACGALADDLADWLERPRAEPLKHGMTVVIAGPPNVGKSSLINALSGLDKAIVTPVPGTTRDEIEVPLSLRGTPIVLVDTAGLRDSDNAVERIGVARAQARVGQADVLLWLGAPEETPPVAHCIRVHSRCDLPERAQVPDGSLPVSAMTGEGIAALSARIADAATQLLPGEDAIALNRRQAGHLAAAHQALRRAGGTRDAALIADDLRTARGEFDRLTGRAGVEDVLDALFGRFCLGK